LREKIDGLAPNDWTHCNSITLTKENNKHILYLSVRNLNQIIKIDVATKEILWKLGEKGDFRMFEKERTEVTKLFRNPAQRKHPALRQWASQRIGNKLQSSYRN